MKVLYFCEGFTDIRFVAGLAEICDLTLVTPDWEYQVSGLAERISQSGAQLKVETIPGRRPAFQARSFMYLLGHIREYDVVLSQEMVRGSLNATVAGRLMGVPVVTYLGISPVEYYRCRHERGEIGWVEAAAGEAFIRFAMGVSGRLGTTAVAMGPYLQKVASKASSHAVSGGYYGVDVDIFSPVTPDERLRLRQCHGLPADRFLILFSSRISHEKDPETVLRATSAARARGIDALVLNLGGGYERFLELAVDMGFTDAADWIVGRPAVHPMKNLCEFYQTADVVIQSSLAEGMGFSTLEALACGTPVIATSVGGMAILLKDVAQLTPRRDARAMMESIAWVAEHPEQARGQALLGRDRVRAHWRREKAFGDLMQVLQEARRERSA